MRRLAIASAASIGVFAYLQWRGSQSTADIYLLGITGVSATLSSVLMVSLTRSWSIRAVGLMMVLTGLAIYADGYVLMYAGVLSRYQFGIALNMVRSVWSVGVPMFVYGLVMIVVSLVGDLRESDDPSTLG